VDPQAILKALPEIVTQLLGFLAVFWVLKRYAFGAMLGVIDERRKAIADAFRDIDAKKAELERLEKEYRSKIQNIEQEARAKIQEAVQEGTRIAQEVRDKAHRDSLARLERAKADIEQETAKARTALRDRIVELSTRMAEKIIRRHVATRGDAAFNEDILKEVEDDILKGAGR
jgi:F-type H+-transporting ATPase subunit b